MKKRKGKLSKNDEAKVMREMVFFCLASVFLVPIAFLSYFGELGDFMQSIAKLLAVICVLLLGNIMYLMDVLMGRKYTSWK